MTNINNVAQLENMTLKELYAHARKFKIAYYSKLTKKELIFAILKSRAEQEGFFFMEGVLEIIQQEGFGFLRPINYSSSSKIFIFPLHKFADLIFEMGTKYQGKYVRQKKMNVIMVYCK